MPTLTVTDDAGRVLLTVDLETGSGLGKALAATTLRAALALARAMGRRIDSLGHARPALSLSFEHDLPLGTSGISLDASVRLGIGVHPPRSTLFGAEDLQLAVRVPRGRAFVSLSAGGRARADLAHDGGTRVFGLRSGAGFTYRYLHRFDVSTAAPKLAEALAETLRHAVVPADLDDLTRLADGAQVSMRGEGDLRLRGKVTLTPLANVLATPGLPLLGAIKVRSKASIDVSASWRVTGEYETRVSKTAPNRVRLAFHRTEASTLAMSGSVAVGVTAKAGQRDLLAVLLQALDADGAPDLDGSSLGDAHASKVAEAVAASLDRTLSLAAELRMSSARRGAAFVAYDLDLDALDAAGRAAVADALAGDLASLDDAAAVPGSGVHLDTESSLHHREQRLTWRLNLLGALNLTSITELVRHGVATCDPAGGTLTIADRVSSTRIALDVRPFQSDADRLRRVVFESVVVTAAYRCSGVLGDLDLALAHAHVERRARTRRADLAAQYDALVALGLCDVDERARQLGATLDFGPSTFLLECRLDRRACEALFLDAQGRPYQAGHYERIARQAFLALLPAGDPSAGYRRAPLEDAAVWSRMRALGQAALARALPPHIAREPVRVAAIAGDYSTIVWWAGAMHRAGLAVLEARRALGGRDPAALRDDPAFAAARGALEDALARVVATTQARWGDPWDVLALAEAGAGRAELNAAIVSAALSAAYRRPALTSPVEGGRLVAPARRSRAAAPPAATPWTVLVWMAGDNDLERFALQDLDEMKRVGSTGGVNIVAQVDRMSDAGTRRYFLRRDTSVAEDVVAELGETNTGDPGVAIDFFTWGLRQYPSSRVLAVIWNHGSGIDEADVYARAAARGIVIERGAGRARAGVVPRAHVRAMLASRHRRALFSTTIDQAMRDRGIAYDDTSRDFLDNAELKRVLLEVKHAAGRPIDVLGLDACLMNMVEVACQLRTTARFIVGSEEVEPGDGWPYDRVMGALAARPSLTARELGAAIVDHYVASYPAGVTQSMLDLSRADACAEAVDRLAAALMTAIRSPGERTAVLRAARAALRFETNEFADLASFCAEIGRRCASPAVKEAARGVRDAISGDEALVAAEAHTGERMAGAGGVSIYLPRTPPSRAYGRLDFARRTRWDEFLAALNRG